MKNIHFSSVSPRELARKYLRKKAWNWFDWNQNFFLKPNDGISNLPLSNQVHDEDVVQALRYFSKFLPDTFLDLGANIGLVSMQLASHVKQVICVEPNPMISSILRVNLALNCNNFVVHEYGLGSKSAIATLFVPRRNLGGAFIRESNEYSSEQLAQKDGFTEYSDTNYLSQPVKIRACNEALLEIRPEIHESLLVKIDVEGLDLLVLKGLIETYEDFFSRSKITIVFESHDTQSVNWLKQRTSAFDYEIYGLKIGVTPALRQPLLRRIYKILKGEQRYLELLTLDELGSNRSVTNFVCCPSKFVTESGPGAAITSLQSH